MSTPEAPIIWCGLDIGIKRDTTGFTAVCPGPHPDTYALYGHRIWRDNPELLRWVAGVAWQGATAADVNP